MRPLRIFPTTGLAAMFVAALFAGPPAYAGDTAPVLETVPIPAGPYVRGSDASEREYGYAIDEKAYGYSATRNGRWYAGELAKGRHTLPAYRIAVSPVTNAQYAAFVRAARRPAPDVDRSTWKSYGLIHPWQRTRRYAWKDGAFPAGRADHPVVLVSHADAAAFAAWLSAETGRTWRLPTEAEWEKAARGTDGRRFPWGDRFEASRLNSHDAGPFDTVPVRSFPSGQSPYGMQDAAGQVFEWTATPGRAGRYVVKGGSWDDKGCGVCRPAARHDRPEGLRHILIGFRLVREE